MTSFITDGENSVYAMRRCRLSFYGNREEAVPGVDKVVDSLSATWFVVCYTLVCELL